MTTAAAPSNTFDRIKARHPNASPEWLIALENALRLREIANQSRRTLTKAEAVDYEEWSAVAGTEIQARAAFTAAWQSLGLTAHKE